MEINEEIIENSVKWPRKKERKGKKEEKVKHAKVKGEEHVNHRGRVIEKRKPGMACR